MHDSKIMFGINIRIGITDMTTCVIPWIQLAPSQWSMRSVDDSCDVRMACGCTVELKGIAIQHSLICHALYECILMITRANISFAIYFFDCLFVRKNGKNVAGLLKCSKELTVN